MKQTAMLTPFVRSRIMIETLDCEVKMEIYCITIVSRAGVCVMLHKVEYNVLVD